MENFIHEFCPTTSSYNKPPEKDDVQTEEDTAIEVDAPFSMGELNIALQSTSNSNPGLDQISNEMLKFSPHKFKKLLLNTFNDIFSNHCYPSEWNEFLILLIPKKEKKKFRKITLASCILKLLEKMIQIRLVHYLEKTMMIPDSQNGFRKFRSCGPCIGNYTILARPLVISLQRRGNVVF